MFERLCGSENYGNVVVLTTNWDRVAKEEGLAVRREAALMEFVGGGAKFMRHEFGNMETARDVLEHIFTLQPTYIAIQKEIRVEGKILEGLNPGPFVPKQPKTQEESSNRQRSRNKYLRFF